MDIPVSDGKRTVKAGPRWVVLRDRLSRLLNSPILFIVLLLATVALGVRWYQLEQSLRAPNIPGWSWSQHPNSLVVYYPHTDCGCGPGLAPVLTQAHSHHVDILIMTDVQGEKLTLVTQQATASQGTIIQAPEAVHKWSRLGNTKILLVYHGRIVHRMDGTNLPGHFFE